MTEQERIAQLQAELHQAQVLLKAIGASENADILKLQADYNSSQQTVRELREKLANERERCARVAEGHRCFNTANQRCMNCIDASKAIAARIRE